MKSTVRTAAFAATVAILAAIASFPGAVEAASVKKPKPPVDVVSTDSHPVPNCPPGDPNGCGIYSN